MTSRLHGNFSRRWLLAVLMLLLFGGLGIAIGLRRARVDVAGGQQNVRINGADRLAPGVLPPRVSRRTARPSGPPFVVAVDASGRYFVDQYGKPILLRGDSPWAMMTKLSPAQARLWFTDRHKRGFNAAIVSLIGAEANGGPDDRGRTVDGLLPFVDGDILRWNDAYWNRAHDYLQIAADQGVTAFLYPIDGWTIGTSFVPTSIDQCRAYGAKLADRFRNLPNVVWMSGGDYFPNAVDPARGSDVDRCIEAMMRGIRSTGDGRPLSIQLGYDKSVSTDNPFWATRVDWNFVYTYYPTYKAVLDAYRHQPPIPAIMGEANYEGENNTGGPPTTDETLRRQVLWALTSGAAGDFMGSQDWKFQDGWQQRLDTAAVRQIDRLHGLIRQLPWWQLVPDVDDTFVTAGRGTRLTTDDPMDVLDNEYVTAAPTADGGTAIVYVPTQRTITIDRSKLAPGTVASWVDPASGAAASAPVADTYTSPGRNSGGDGDWLLLFRAPPKR